MSALEVKAMQGSANVIPLSPVVSHSDASRLYDARKRQRKILVVDDEPLLLSGIRRALKRMKYEAICVDDPLKALAYLDEHGPADVILTDQRMPYMTGAELLERVQEKWPEMVRVCMSGHADRPEILDSINAGHVFRFLMKPWDLSDFQQVIEAAVREADAQVEHGLLENVLQYQNRSLREDNEGLHVVVKKRTRELEEKSRQLDAALMETVRALAYSIEAKDAYTAGHSELVSRFAVALARRIGLEGDDLQALRLGGILHDVGKLGVPDRIHLKPGRLE